MTRRMIRQSALGVAAFAVLALVLGTLQLLVSPAASETPTTVAYAADYATEAGSHLTEVAEGMWAWAPDAQNISLLEGQGATVVPVAHQSLATADGVAAVAASGASHLFLGESFYRGFLTDDVVAGLGHSGLHLVTVRSATLAMLAPGLATPQSPMDLKMVDVGGEATAIHGWAMPVEAVSDGLDALATREDGGIAVGSAMVGTQCVSLFGFPWGASTDGAGDLLSGVLSCGSMTDEAPVDEAPVDEAPVGEAPEDEAPVDETPVDEAPVDEAPEDEAPVGEAPEDEAPVGEVPVDETPVEDAPADDVPVDEVPVDLTPVDDAPAEGEVIADDGLVDLPLISVI